MKILKTITVPTGHILIVEGDKGKLECLSLGDYGKDVNIKCDALGLTREPSAVRHTKLLPLEEKWVITVSTQYGCSQNCTFCDVPKVGPGINATLNDLVSQVDIAMALHPEVSESHRLNIHYARMGEPTYNPNVIESALEIGAKLNKTHCVHPVVSTMMPWRNGNLEPFLRAWMELKNNPLGYNGNAGLQLSINSTNDAERSSMFSGNAMNLNAISGLMSFLPKPIGRKITLNFAVAGYEIDPAKLRKNFPPEYFIIKLTPMHKTDMAIKNGIATAGDATSYHPYQKHEAELRAAGYDVLVFIASEEEDAGRITCGNAIISGTLPTCEYTIKENQNEN